MCAGNHWRQVEQYTAEIRISLQNRSEQQAATARDIHQLPEPAEVVGLRDGGRALPAVVRHRAIENGRLLVMSLEILERIRQTERLLQPALPGLDTMHQLSPRRRSARHRHEPGELFHRVRSIATQARG